MATNSQNYISVVYLGNGEYGIVAMSNDKEQQILYRGSSASEMFKMAMTTYSNSSTVYIPETIQVILDLEARILLQKFYDDLAACFQNNTEKKPSTLGKAKKKPFGKSLDSLPPKSDESKPT